MDNSIPPIQYSRVDVFQDGSIAAFGEAAPGITGSAYIDGSPVVDSFEPTAAMQTMLRKHLPHELKYDSKKHAFQRRRGI